MTSEVVDSVQHVSLLHVELHHIQEQLARERGCREAENEAFWSELARLNAELTKLAGQGKVVKAEETARVVKVEEASTQETLLFDSWDALATDRKSVSRMSEKVDLHKGQMVNLQGIDGNLDELLNRLTMAELILKRVENRIEETMANLDYIEISRPAKISALGTPRAKTSEVISEIPTSEQGRLSTSGNMFGHMMSWGARGSDSSGGKRGSVIGRRLSLIGNILTRAVPTRGSLTT
eukprot:CAMPEP_0194523922 /NCGR_PEP_ID=MMETSP0253-20130528/58939_1 /TAXON_ID=2966 /ORGANISM="Noctiluca scintillans" /LENGTH=236 /DNA_ID=CAMNT_0039368501 /DNA_START=169 /DNA_END=879 /DNA_ORIENTATION=+